MTLDERALAHGRAALASKDAEKKIGELTWEGFPDDGGVSLDESGFGECPCSCDIYAAIDLACVMYAQQVDKRERFE